MSLTAERKFGLLIASLCLVAAFSKGSQIAAWAALTFFVVTLLRAQLLKWPLRLWLKVGELLHRIVSPVILGVLFFVVITPAGLLIRIFGGDLLRLKRKSETYWLVADPSGGQMERQF